MLFLAHNTFTKPIKNYLKWCIVWICVLALGLCDWLCGHAVMNVNHVAAMLLHMQARPCACECEEQKRTHL